MIFVADSERPTIEEVEQAQEANSDGTGVAWRDNQTGFVRWKKGLSLKEAKELSQSLPFPFAMHFRIATIGEAVEALTHPFPIEYKVRLDLRGKTDRGLLMHNGHWGQWDKKIPKNVVNNGLWSDTRGIAWQLARAANPKHFEHLLAKGIPGRFAYICKEGVKMYGSFDKIRPGFFASNTYWQRRVYSNKPYSEPDYEGLMNEQAWLEYVAARSAELARRSEPTVFDGEYLRSRGYIQDAEGVWRKAIASRIKDEITRQNSREADLAMAASIAEIQAANVDEDEADLRVTESLDDIACNYCQASGIAIELAGHQGGCPHEGLGLEDMLAQSIALDQSAPGMQVDDETGQVIDGFASWEEELRAIRGGH